MTNSFKTERRFKSPFSKKQAVEGAMVAILAIKTETRGITLLPYPSRAVLKNEIHELMVTDESVSPDDAVNRIHYLGFFEVTAGGIIVTGDTFRIKDQVLGHIVGFNDAHMPNHLNIVIHSQNLKTGAELGIEPGDKLMFKS